jgi:hypothetical protein
MHWVALGIIPEVACFTSGHAIVRRRRTCSLAACGLGGNDKLPRRGDPRESRIKSETD